MKQNTAKKPAKICYNHIGGKLGTLLLEEFIHKGWIAKENPEAKHFYITEEGIKGLTTLGIDVSKIQSEEI